MRFLKRSVLSHSMNNRRIRTDVKKAMKMAARNSAPEGKASGRRLAPRERMAAQATRLPAVRSNMLLRPLVHSQSYRPKVEFIRARIEANNQGLNSPPIP